MKVKAIKQKMAQKKLSPSRLAEQIGISPMTVYQNILRGKRTSKPIMLLMAHVLECDLEEIATREELERTA